MHVFYSISGFTVATLSQTKISVMTKVKTNFDLKFAFAVIYFAI